MAENRVPTPVPESESILRVERVDVVQFGDGADHDMSIGLAGQREHPRVIEAREYTSSAAPGMGAQSRLVVGAGRQRRCRIPS